VGEAGPSLLGVHKDTWKYEVNGKMGRAFSITEELACVYWKVPLGLSS